LAERFTLLIGKNGAGKTSALDALRIAIDEFIPDHSGVSPVPFRAEDVREVSFGSGRQIHFERAYPAHVRLEAVFNGVPMDFATVRTEHRETLSASALLDSYHEQVKSEIRSEINRILPVIAFYGLDRFNVSPKTRTTSKGSTRSRLDGYVDATRSIINYEQLLAWWKDRDYESLTLQSESSPLDAVKSVLSSCVPGVEDLVYDPIVGDLIVTIGGVAEPLSRSSSGYRQFITLMTDIARRAAILNPFMRGKDVLKAPGIVLIDEIDGHLHPEWQRRVCYDLIKTFPRMQFIVSSHSPFIVQGVPESDGRTSIVRLDDMHVIKPQEMSVEVAAEYVQGVSDPDRSYSYQVQSHKIANALRTAETHPSEGNEALEEVVESEPLDPVSRALLEIKRIALAGEQGNH
jgi:predicted ATP-binding protein involved in virulence